MSSSPSISRQTESSQRFIDRQMVNVIEAIVTHTYSLAHKGLVPAEREIAVYVAAFDEAALLETIRKHPGAASTQVLTATDEDVLRWARLVGRVPN